MAKPKKKDKQAVQGVGVKYYILLLAVVLGCLSSLPTAIMFMIGMLPTMGAAFISQGPQRSRVITVGALNFVGCLPFLLRLWSSGVGYEKAMGMVLDPVVVIIIYSVAGAGYVIDWVLSTYIASFMKRRAKRRLQAISEKQAKLRERWGKEVTGG